MSGFHYQTDQLGRFISWIKKGAAYGWASSGEFIFSDGIVDSRNNKFYPWLDDQQILLNSKPEPATKEQLSVINKEHYRLLLKQYLIVQDYQQQ